MMFTALAEIAKTTNLTVKISSVGDELRVLVIPEEKPGANPALHQLLGMTASPQELDESFVASVLKYGAERKSLSETLAETTAIMAAASKEAKDKAAKAVSSTATAKPSASAAQRPQIGTVAPAAPATQVDEEDSDLSLF